MQTWIVVAVLAAIAIYAIRVFNRLVRLRNLVREGWSGIDVQLKRRTDLVPNLVETVKAYAAHERGVLEEVTATRASSIARQRRAQARPRPRRPCRRALGQLFAVAEAYPELKADKNFLALQQQLAEIEDQLQMARRYYNGTVRNLNIEHPVVSEQLWPACCGFTRAPFFELEDRGAGRRARRSRFRRPVRAVMRLPCAAAMLARSHAAAGCGRAPA